MDCELFDRLTKERDEARADCKMWKDLAEVVAKAYGACVVERDQLNLMRLRLEAELHEMREEN